jgi:hypothetical protein
MLYNVPMTEKEIIFNLYLEGKSYKEIEEETGLTQETISEHLSLGLLAEMQEKQMRCYKPKLDWHLPPGSPTALLYAARSIWKNEPEKLAWYEKSYKEHLDRHNEEKPGTWVNGTWYAWDFENGYPWSDQEKSYNWRPV